MANQVVKEMPNKILLKSIKRTHIYYLCRGKKRGWRKIKRFYFLLHISYIKKGAFHIGHETNESKFTEFVCWGLFITHEYSPPPLKPVSYALTWLDVYEKERERCNSIFGGDNVAKGQIIFVCLRCVCVCVCAEEGRVYST